MCIIVYTHGVVRPFHFAPLAFDVMASVCTTAKTVGVSGRWFVSDHFCHTRSRSFIKEIQHMNAALLLPNHFVTYCLQLAGDSVMLQQLADS
jgi:hypothetical protein